MWWGFKQPAISSTASDEYDMHVHSATAAQGWADEERKCFKVETHQLKHDSIQRHACIKDQTGERETGDFHHGRALSDRTAPELNAFLV